MKIPFDACENERLPQWAIVSVYGAHRATSSNVKYGKRGRFSVVVPVAVSSRMQGIILAA
jgi:hypothetical protein